MIIQTIFDRMSVYDNQLSLLAGGDDVVRGLVVVNLVQDWLEAALGRIADVCQTTVDNELNTTANQNYSAWPTALLRLDSLWAIDSNGAELYELDPDFEPGAHLNANPFAFAGAVSVGRPQSYFATGQGSNIRWDFTPDAVYAHRVYGLHAKDDYTAAANTFAYPDTLALVVAPHAVQVFRTGLDRDLSDVQAAAEAAFTRAAGVMTHQVHTGARARVYRDFHIT